MHKGSNPHNDAPRPRNVVERAKLRTKRKQLRRHGAAGVLLLGAVVALCAAFIALLLMLGRVSISQTLVLRGQMQAVEHAIPVAHDQSGIIKEIFVTEGELVSEGQILATLDTSSIMGELRHAQKEVAKILLAIECLQAQREYAIDFQPSIALKQAMGRLQQLTQLQRGTRDCRIDLRKLALREANSALQEKTALDVAHLYRRIAQTIVATESITLIIPDQIGPRAANATRLLAAFETTARAKQAQQKSKQLQTRRIAGELDHQRDIDRQIDALSDELVFAESYLSTQDALLKKRYIYATASGRIQRLRIKAPGIRLAKGAYFVEIAPIQTDFEVLSRTSNFVASNLAPGQAVQVKLSGELPHDVWLPAEISKIQKLSENKRLISILLRRADLNQRNLLNDDRTLNGLGEQSEALVAIKPEDALTTLRHSFWQLLQQWRRSSALLQANATPKITS